MEPTRRELMKAIAAAACLPPGFAAAAAPEAWPSRTVRAVVGFPPGGATDYVARQVTAVWNGSVGQQFVVDNKPGATGTLAAIETARAAPDGYTLLFALDSHAILHLMNKHLPYDTFTSFDYLSLLVTLPQAIVVPRASPIVSLKDLLARARQEPLTYGTTGVASAAHQNVLRMLASEKLSATHVPYKGAAPMVTDLIGGHLPFGSAGLSVVMPFIKAGSVRALAVSSLQRSPLVPDVPTIAETIPGHESISWVGLVAPVGLPAAVRQKILAASHAAMRVESVRKTLQDNSFTVVDSGPEELVSRVRRDAETVQDLVSRNILVME